MLEEISPYKARVLRKSKGLHVGKLVLKNNFGNLIFQFLKFYSENLNKSYNIQFLKNKVTFLILLEDMNYSGIIFLMILNKYH